MSDEYAGMLIRWLARRGPTEWHGVAAAWNYHCDVAPILWILDQPTCDRATALDAFWRNDGYYQIDPTHPQYRAGSDAAQVVASVLENWPRYSTSRFHFRLPDHSKYVRNENYKLSPYALERLEPLMIEIDGTERYPMYGEDGPAECRVEYLEKAGKPVDPEYRERLVRERTDPFMAPRTEELKQRNLKARDREWEEAAKSFQSLVELAEKFKKGKF
jgi:Domain of unknown function (DUF4274)